MNTIEDRIRAATRAAGNSVRPGSVPPLRLPPELMNGARPRGERSRPGGWARWSRWLAPVAAAAAVAAIAVTLVAVRGPVHRGGVADSRGAGVPPYYVAINAHGNPNFVLTYAVVRATMTGALLATIMPSIRGGMIAAVTAAADDRTFVLDEQKRVSAADQASQTRLFYLLRLDSSGRPASVTKLPMTAAPMVTGVALSPDGTRLAMAVEPDNDPKHPGLTEIRIYTLATGAVRTWRADGTIGTGEDDAGSISWTADGRTLAFDWYTDAPDGPSGVRLLDVTLGGSSLLADSRLAVPLTTAPASGLTCQTDVIITADGSKAVCGAQRVGGPLPSASTGFLEYSTATGKVVRTLYYRTSHLPGVIGLMWVNASGSVLIGTVPSRGDGQVGIISGDDIAPLRVPDSLNPAYAGVW